ncbi:ER-derived vesicles protein 41 [Fulvia fulva]|uniref:Endoplasmic reticulum-Golgi intermediate compartment protein n=1 Tax=Passalora fulva TaxID=5499 RepID=A0A9Q8P3B4_PASFU|nr:ER-derived vesicles protein 41 [Fulvia fulva]KAK4635519.1 ER-derived vesicles protein 41 [Fulvia fulva]KAK4637266.1 ER-derived vesicles protein 41 [Fulvia fulva]UJO11537.1 ER-derived vesicles protein 41 [Fulvia fulva]WPV08666.1 ER-derived vesicles protein 41 [Fulvia fulva]WPV24522.1 ER-derived vesicles protein 41 [Fulvia fulva]
MNGFSDRGLDDSNFGESKASSVVKSFDAFPKTKPSYTQRTESGGVWTVVLIVASLFLGWSELSRWWVGETTHTFAVEQGVGHDLQINLDVVVAMQCSDLHVNVQDSSGDRILAGSALKKDATTWRQWGGRSHALAADKDERIRSGYDGKGAEYDEEDVHNYVGAARRKKKFKKTPGLPWGAQADSCRIYGSMHGNKVQGDFHITARGHGYMEFGAHLDHSTFNFSHTVNELSFGPFYPSLTNPLDNTVATTSDHFYKFQYYLSVVPTIYTTDAKTLRKIDKHHESPSSGEDGLSQYPHRYNKNTVFTNQYAVTEQSHKVPENAVPGVFIKFDIEPIGLTIAEEWSSIPALLIRLVNVVSGLLVAGGWCFQISEWAKEIYGRKGRRQDSFGMLNGEHDEKRGL